MPSFRMFQAVLQDRLKGPCADERGLDQDAATAVEERISVHLEGRCPNALGGRQSRVYLDVPDVRHRGRVY